MDITTNTSFGVNSLFNFGLIELTDAIVPSRPPSQYEADIFSYTLGSGIGDGATFSGTGSNFTYDSDGSINGGFLRSFTIDKFDKLVGGPIIQDTTAISNLNSSIKSTSSQGFWDKLLDGDDTIDFVSTPGHSPFVGGITINSGRGNDQLVDSNQNATTARGLPTTNTIDLGIGNDSLQLNYTTGNFSIALGDGADKVVQMAAKTAIDEIGLRSIKDFNPAEDKIILPSNEAGTTIYHIVDTDAGAVLRSTGANASDIMLLEGVSLNQIQMKDGIISGADVTSNGDDQYGLPIYGSDFADTLHGTDGNDLIYAGDGNDTIIGYNGEDLIFGEGGRDYIFGGKANDFILGNEGYDRLKGGDGDDQIFGGSGSDGIHGEDGNDRLFGETGNDHVNGGNGDDLVVGGQGYDFLLGGAGDDVIAGGEGNDVLKGDTGEDVLFGDEGDDNLFGSSGKDVLYGGSGDDILTGGLDADLIDGNEGINTASYANSQNGINISLESRYANGGDAEGDRLINIDNVIGSGQNDIIIGGFRDNELSGIAGNDRLFGRGGDDTLIGGLGNDQLNGDAGHDILNGGHGDDILFGGTGDDQLFGDSGNDKLIAGAGNDDLIAGPGNDLLEGGAGNDFFAAGTGNDEIHMGEGNDYYLLQTDGHGTSFGADVIKDFDVNNDLIIFESKSVTADTISSFFQQTGEGLLIEVDNSSVLLHGLTADDLNTSSNFEFG